MAQNDAAHFQEPQVQPEQKVADTKMHTTDTAVFAAAPAAAAAATAAASAASAHAVKAPAAGRPNPSRWQRLLRLARLNILVLAITTGVSTYFLFHYVELLAPIKYPIKHFIDGIVPWLIFTMLFIAFCKVEIKKMKPSRWHWILVAFQLLIPALTVLVINQMELTDAAEIQLEGFIACIITPTAAAASVITGKLGGDENALTSFTIISNLGAAVGIPLLFPLISASASVSGFWYELLLIMSRVFPMIVLPLVMAQIIRYCFKGLHHFIVTRLKEVSFYIWAFTLTSISATACSNMMNSSQSAEVMTGLALIGLVTTVLQFGLGKLTGHLEGQRISAGQALGQKNMVFGIWVTSTYLSPAASIAPGCYILWQNIVNSWQLWYRESRHLTYTDRLN